ncbi:ABC transporter permease [Lysinibacillus odysseyi]|uniref:Membrane protein n=1 Tax=Lysinibacillus odysseyi 34hs-1 = NBRC 100172 TaxID=1220589 RepID=A0A0A3IWY0_9BACI|nr:iron export ABC transporter permease subunit FetB [Lysinibacillus odysseyi]KGR87403.1 membrane protein [Lysinibacillus odysseyi 34hs-1 = NBRC 100172]
MTYGTLSLTLIFIFIPFLLSKSLKLSLEKDITIATVRSVIQLLAIGYVLHFIFGTDNYVYILLMILLMITVATLNARKKGVGIPGITWKIAITLLTVELVTQGVLLGLGIVPATAQYIIPISGMMIGNAMVLSVLFLNRFRAELEANENEIELILSLGGTPKQAVHRHLMSAIKASMIPTIEAQKTIGLVQLPGMMSGQIIGGADPIQAVQFQILIIFALLTCATLASVILGFLVYPTLFNERMQRIAVLRK